MLMRYVENNFTTAFYNTIGVDFVIHLLFQKMKNIEIDGRKVRMQVVLYAKILVGYRWSRQIQNNYINILQVNQHII